MLGSRRWERYADYKQSRRRTNPFLRVLVMVIYVLFGVQIAWALFLQSYRVTSVAMSPTLQPGDRVLVHRLADGPLGGIRGESRRMPQRGDLVLLRPSYAPQATSFTRVVDGALRFVTLQKVSAFSSDGPADTRLVFRRVLGLPGDRIRMDDYVFRIRAGEGGGFQNEFETTGLTYELERTLPPAGWRREDPFSGTMEPVVVDESTLFVAGDNRGATLDSRHWGALESTEVRGRVFFRYWPLSRFGRL